MSAYTYRTLRGELTAVEIGTGAEFLFDPGDVLRVISTGVGGSARSVVAWAPPTEGAGMIGPCRVWPNWLDAVASGPS